MKNLKKISRNGLKSIKGGTYVSCPMPSGTPALCPGTVCPPDPCTARPFCIRSIDDCGSGVIW
ncbi:bacteriocin-like protein [Chryseobacterium sp.]|uniref:bacteriocin-like protein n=1 Tax=Chryseobacterium sp. TaxID=1871047 RepID=UPI0038CD4FDF